MSWLIVSKKDTVHSICNLKYSIPKEITVVFHNESNYDYHFIKRELVEEFEWQFNCLGENTEKCRTYLVLIEEEVKRFDKNWEKLQIPYLTI